MMLQSMWATLALALVFVGVVQVSAEEKSPLNFTVKSLSGKEVELNKYKGNVVLIVNVASKCGLTPQYKDLQAVQDKYKEEGLSVLGFPCNQFGGQEPGSEAEISEFCTTKYNVKFDMFSKVDVNGDGASDVYKVLTSTETKPVEKGDIKWNFEKFLIGRDGKVVARFAPRTSPNDPAVVKAIEAELAKK